MRISKKLIAEVTGEAVGEDVVDLAQSLNGRNDVSEFLLAKEQGVDINTVRNMLYRLHNHNLVSFIKKKDYQKGWYVYYWTLNKQRMVELVDVIKENRIKFLQRRLSREREHIFFMCCNKCTRLDFDKATDVEFRCPECSSILVEQDNTKTINQIEMELNKLDVKAS